MKEVTLASGVVVVINDTQEAVIDGALPQLLKMAINNILFDLEGYEDALPNPVGFPLGGVAILKNFITNGCRASKEQLVQKIDKVFKFSAPKSESLPEEIKKFINDTFAMQLENFRTIIQNPNILKYDNKIFVPIFTAATTTGGSLRLKDSEEELDTDLQKEALANHVREKSLEILSEIVKDKEIEILQKHSARLELSLRARVLASAARDGEGDVGSETSSDDELEGASAVVSADPGVEEDADGRSSGLSSADDELGISAGAGAAIVVVPATPAKDAGEVEAPARRSPSATPSPEFKLNLDDEEEAARKLAGDGMSQLPARK